MDAVEQRPGITLVLGGARSGKSEVAEGLVAAMGDSIAYVATGPRADPRVDPDWAARVRAHRLRRPEQWATVEVEAGADLGAALAGLEVPVIVDSLGTWVAGLEDFGDGPGPALDDGPRLAPGAERDRGDATAFTALVAALVERRAAGRATVVVSEEVGLGVHPPTAVGGAFRDALGVLNQRVAGVADRVLLVVVGRVHQLAARPDDGRPPARPDDDQTGDHPDVAGRDRLRPAGADRVDAPATDPAADGRAAAGPDGWVSGARRSMAFLTAFGGAASPDARTFWWFPLTGGAIGAVLGTVWWAAAKIWPQALAAVIVVGLDLAVTGLLHLDGLVDSADGLLPHLDRSRRLAVMREPSVGAFGVGVAGVVLLGRWAALSVARPSVLLLVGLWMASRTAMGVVAVTVPYARAGQGGLATAFLPTARPGYGASSDPSHPSHATLLIAALGALGAVAAVVAWGPLAGGVSLAVGVLAAAGVVWLAWRRLGGFTGDVLGAAGITLETAALVVAAAKW